MKGIFVAGADTDAGKTAVGVALGVWLKNKGVPLRVLKPFETGCLPGKEGMMPLDGSLYRLFLDLACPIEEIVPFRFSKPLAPYQTAVLDGCPIDYRDSLSFIKDSLAAESFCLLEGAGGLMVPLERKIFLIDLIEDLKYPVLLVAPNRLGTINHTLLSLQALEARGIEIAGVVLSEKERAASQVKGLNREYFRDILGERYLGEFPYLPSWDRFLKGWPAMLKEGRPPTKQEVRALRKRLLKNFEALKGSNLYS